jgi:hypothetical protein
MINLWQIFQLDLDEFLKRGGELQRIGFPDSPAEHQHMINALSCLPEEVATARLARLSRFVMLLLETPRCTSEAQLRQAWTWSEPTLQ